MTRLVLGDEEGMREEDMVVVVVVELLTGKPAGPAGPRGPVPPGIP